jgi:hypothetical protein
MIFEAEKFQIFSLDLLFKIIHSDGSEKASSQTTQLSGDLHHDELDSAQFLLLVVLRCQKLALISRKKTQFLLRQNQQFDEFCNSSGLLGPITSTRAQCGLEDPLIFTIFVTCQCDDHISLAVK